MTLILALILLFQFPQQPSTAQQEAIRSETVVLVFSDHVEITTRGAAEDEYLSMERNADPKRRAALELALMVHPDACAHYLCPANSGALIAPFPETQRKSSR